MIALLLVIFFAGIFGPPPASERALAISVLGLWLFPPWAYWIDKHRAPVALGTGSSARTPHLP